jgi:uncharacterized protein YjdB
VRNGLQNTHLAAVWLLCAVVSLYLVFVAGIFGLPPLNASNPSQSALSVNIVAPSYVTDNTSFVAAVIVSQASDLTAFQFRLVYDPAVITVTDILPGNIQNSATAVYYQFPLGTPGLINIAGHALDWHSLTGAGELAEIVFAVIGPPGSSSTLSFENSEQYKNSLFDISTSPIEPVSWGNTSLNVIAALRIAGPDSLPDGKVKVPYQYFLQANGGLAPYSWQMENSSLPAGLVFNPQGAALSGVPLLSGGPYPLKFQVTDSLGQKSLKEFNLSIGIQAPVINTLAASGIGPENATLQGALVNLGSAAGVNTFFDVWPDSGSQLRVPAQPSPVSADNITFYFSLDNLMSCTPYHYRAVGIWDNLTVFGPELTFTTSPYTTGLQLVSSAAQVNTGANISIAVQAVAPTVYFESAGFSLQFDPHVLTVLDSDPALDGVQIKAEPFLQTQYENQVDNVAGLITFRGGKLTARDFKSDLVLAEVLFHVKEVPTTRTEIQFINTPDYFTRVDFQGLNITGPTQGCNFLLKNIVSPVVTAVTPTDHAVFVPVDSSIILSFSKSMEPVSTQQALLFTPPLEGHFNWSSDGRILTFSPAPPLAYSTTYALDFEGAARDTDNCTLSAPLHIEFTTTTILTSLSIEPDNLTLALGKSYQLAIQVTYSDGTHIPVPNIQWSSADPQNVGVSQSGLVSALQPAAGPHIIRAVSGPLSAESRVWVGPPVLDNFTLSPAEVSLLVGETRQFVVSPTYSDGTHAPLPAVTWSSSAPDYIEVSSGGLATALKARLTPVILQAVSGDLRATAAVSITDPPIVLTSLSIEPDNLTLALGKSYQLAIQVTYSDGTHIPVPNIQWSSADPQNVGVSQSGLVSALQPAAGPHIIRAESGPLSAESRVWVVPPVLDNFTLSPAEVSLLVGETRQFVVSPTYSDGTHAPLPAVTWSSSAPDYVEVSSGGQATALKATITPVIIQAVSGDLKCDAGVMVFPVVDLFLSPARLDVSPDSDFWVYLKSSGGLADNVSLQLAFDPAELQVVDADSQKSGLQIAPGSWFSSIAINHVDNLTGLITFVASNPSDLRLPDNLTIAAIQFKAVPQLAISELKFGTRDNISVVYQGKNVTGSLTGSTFFIPPTVQITPGNGLTNIAVDSSITLSFSRPMDQASVQQAFIIQPAVNGNFTWDQSASIATFQPQYAMTNGALYTITLDSSAMDQYGLHLYQNQASTFITVAAPASGGGDGGGNGEAGSGGGGLSHSLIHYQLTVKGFKTASTLFINNLGVVDSDVILESPDGKMTLTISQGTKMLTVDRQALTDLQTELLGAFPPASSPNFFLLAFSCGPEGAIFDPAITLTFRYQVNNLPDGVAEESLQIALFNGNTWQLLSSRIDQSSHLVSCEITHFSVYALVGAYTQTRVVVTPSPQPSTSPAPVVKSTPQPAIVPPPVIVTAPLASPAGINPAPAVKPDDRLQLTPSLSSVTPLVTIAAVPLTTESDAFPPAPNLPQKNSRRFTWNWGIFVISGGLILCVLGIILRRGKRSLK